jgi:hypothetical protein
LLVAVSFLLSCQEKLITEDGTNSDFIFRGQALAVQAEVLGIPMTLANTGSLAKTGGVREASLMTRNIPDMITGKVIYASTIGQGDRSRSEAALADLRLTVGKDTITVGFLMARAMAVCGPSVSGSSEIADLIVNGKAIVVSGQPNQKIFLPNGRIVIDEQKRSVKGNAGDMTVNALHVIVDGVADIVISSAQAGITCNDEPVCKGDDFVTGGGWITGTPSGEKANFSVGGGIKENGDLTGHLTYIDKGSNNLRVKETGVTAYEVVNPTTRRIRGTAEINGQGGFTFEVVVADNGEPGRDDTFVLNLSNGYNASGNLGGGNIQLHKPCQ